MKVNIYDFDKTVLPFDSGSKFWLYCAKRYPKVLLCLPYQAVCGVMMVSGRKSMEQVKSGFFSFVRFIPLEKAVRDFWDKYESSVFDFAKPESRPGTTVVISASPDFLLNEIAKRLKFDTLMCTNHDAATGRVIGKNCRGEEKISRFRELYPDAEVELVFSDSLKHDRPIFSLGKRCFHIQKDGTQKEFVYGEVYDESGSIRE